MSAGPLGRLLFLIVAFAAASMASAAPDPSGVWALRADGAVLFTIEVKRTPRGWSGLWVRPDHFSFSGAAISDVKGPVVRRPSMAAREAGGGVELTFDDPGPNAYPDKLTIRPLAGGRAELAWENLTDKILLVRAARGAAPVPAQLAGRSFALPFNRPTNPEMTAMFEADQAARLGGKVIDWSVVGAQDREHRKRAKALLDSGALASGDDFYHAAFIFQHGDKPEDYLLAHSLAVIAAARGRPDAAWIAAATLDRYLQSIGQKQVYGTQYMTRAGEAVTQEPYDRTLLSDALRAAMGVPPQAAQEKRRLEMDSRNRAPAAH
jgi:hypothetical protein